MPANDRVERGLRLLKFLGLSRALKCSFVKSLEYRDIMRDVLPAVDLTKLPYPGGEFDPMQDGLLLFYNGLWPDLRSPDGEEVDRGGDRRDHQVPAV